MDPIQQMLTAVVDDVRDLDAGATAHYIPELAAADPDRLALAVVGPRGRTIAVGDVDATFTIQSISKPFVFALAVEELGRAAVLRQSASSPAASRSTRSASRRGRADPPIRSSTPARSRPPD
ncbi:glutaminase [Microbacterium dextranolyticum]|uniref:glutaminase n=1 Tax=Microbacterium dextranolyticum TaxID=36806 RepID=A0A9W6HML4_9MICO|nr:glutaminase [Microbacterium dextranolyticum]MBM7463067.1 glutaminase [Microbacterium dextranolyticum]GLJ95828.1 hypothetical protein GCM10017591_18910 [Microbacterium dextranolyticum]